HRRGAPARRAGPARRHRHRFHGGTIMKTVVEPMTPDELARIQPLPDDGLGALATDRGNLPLERLDVQAAVCGLVARTELTQGFHTPHAVPLEATYIFPLPDRAAVTGMRMDADGRTVDAELRERGAARAAYDRALATGRRASIAEQERPDVFTMRVGNIMPGERVSVRLTMVGPLPYADGEATYRLPLVVAPRDGPGDPPPGGPGRPAPRGPGGRRPGADARRRAGRPRDPPAGAAARLPEPGAAVDRRGRRPGRAAAGGRPVQPARRDGRRPPRRGGRRAEPGRP